jgi:hypothetical protein
MHYDHNFIEWAGNELVTSTVYVIMLGTNALMLLLHMAPKSKTWLEKSKANLKWTKKK